ncbi:MAG: hypothetical protein PHP59_02170 [Methanofollis sp.]|uniref:hypothetical protein n=1 Tax=Methanofollis sp. TaxID=2052835 RepID=UPI00261A4D84|nr:hypothetical protein [Methanofollis sp.]MDD4254162.1 hypothetical protein [Methanofollis sp.]
MTSISKAPPHGKILDCRLLMLTLSVRTPKVFDPLAFFFRNFCSIFPGSILREGSGRDYGEGRGSTPALMESRAYIDPIMRMYHENYRR